MVLAELRRDETPGCDLEDDCNLNTFAVGCDVRQRRKKMPPGQRAGLSVTNSLVYGAVARRSTHELSHD